MKKELSVNSTTENLKDIRDFIKNEALNAGFATDAAEKIILAVDEACTNIIKHAYKYSINGLISISVNNENNKFVVSIIDDGGHFNPNDVPEPDVREYHKQRKPGGLGMFLMRKLMDEVVYNNLSDNRNQVVLVKNLPQ